MFQKYLVIASKKDRAGMNICSHLSQFKDDLIISSENKKQSFDFYLVDEEIIFTENLDIGKINSYDFIIFASRHKSEKGDKSLSVHCPGNFRDAEFGGESKRVCPSSALFNKCLFEKLNQQAKEANLTEYKVTLEVTHHGPLINKPCVFIEIGSTETEWANRRAGFIIAKTIKETIEEFQENKYREVAIGIGGPHYCPSFNNIQLKSNIALSHIIAGYHMPLSQEMILEAIRKTFEEVDFALIDWKGLGKAEQRDEVIKILEENYISWKKTSDVKR